jgi:alkylation response protein AidB-like acyl-CoA dehydrogenase
VELDLDDDQLSLRKAAREILTSSCPPQVVRELRESPEPEPAGERLWRRLAELDLLRLTVPEDEGGIGGSDVELAILLEEAGRVALPGPLLETVVVTSVLAEVAREPDHRAWLRALGEGAATATVVRDGGLAAWADRAAVGLVVTDGELHLVPAEKLDMTPLVGVDGVRPLATARCTPDAATRLSTDAGVLRRLDDRLAVAVSALLVGIGAQLVEMTVEHVRERTQFGRPIGSFQAVKHRLAEAHQAVETARPAVWAAAALIADHDPGCSVAAAVARHQATHAAALANTHALQCHGGIGFTVEHDLHLWLKFGKATEHAYGSARSARAAIASSLFGPSGGTAAGT